MFQRLTLKSSEERNVSPSLQRDIEFIWYACALTYFLLFVALTTVSVVLTFGIWRGDVTTVPVVYTLWVRSYGRSGGEREEEDIRVKRWRDGFYSKHKIHILTMIESDVLEQWRTIGRFRRWSIQLHTTHCFDLFVVHLPQLDRLVICCEKHKRTLTSFAKFDFVNLLLDFQTLEIIELGLVTLKIYVKLKIVIYNFLLLLLWWWPEWCLLFGHKFWCLVRGFEDTDATCRSRVYNILKIESICIHIHNIVRTASITCS